MIDQALKVVAEDLNAALRRQHDDNRDRIIVSHFVDQQGKPVGEGQDQIYLLLTQVAEEKNTMSGALPDRSPAPRAQLNEPIHLNLHIMFAALYNRYEIGLQVLAEVIAYLHDKPIFDPANTPGMEPGLSRLALNLMKLTYAEQSSLWSCLGARYVPSVLYSVRMLSFGGGRVEALLPSVTTPVVTGRPQTGVIRR